MSQPANPSTNSAAGASRSLRPKKARKTYMLHDAKTMKAIGRFSSTSPRSAAQKAASRGFEKILLRETGTRVIHEYEGAIVSIDPPKVVKRGDATVTFKKKSTVKAISKTVWNGAMPDDSAAANVVENPKAPTT